MTNEIEFSEAEAAKDPKNISGFMYDCEVWTRHTLDKKVWFEWRPKKVEWIPEESTVSIRCMHCHGEVKTYRKRKDHAANDHVHHVHRSDSENCRGGIYFRELKKNPDTDHQISTRPVEIR